jgi:hypothetical protein
VVVAAALEHAEEPVVVLGTRSARSRASASAISLAAKRVVGGVGGETPRETASSRTTATLVPSQGAVGLRLFLPSVGTEIFLPTNTKRPIAEPARRDAAERHPPPASACAVFARSAVALLGSHRVIAPELRG